MEIKEIRAIGIANKITEYFILEKRFMRCRGRKILFDEDDSHRLAKIIYKLIEEG